MSLKVRTMFFGVLVALSLLIFSSVFAASSSLYNNFVDSYNKTDENINKNVEISNIEGKVPVSRVVKYPIGESYPINVYV